jgi:WD40 repeat protein
MLWNYRTRSWIGPLEHGHEIDDVAFSPDGTFVATASRDRTATVWDSRTGAKVMSLGAPCSSAVLPNCHGEWVSSVVFSPTRPIVATGSWDKGVRLWDARTGAFLKRLDLPSVTHPIRRLAFHPDGVHLAIATHSGSITVVDIEGQSEPVTWPGHDAAINDLAYNDKGTLLATAGDDRTARVWDAKDGRLKLTLPSSALVKGIAFNRDGTLLAAGGDDRQAHIYLLDEKQLVELARNRITRKLTRDECRRYLPAGERCPSEE